jgi:RNA polymerase sigma-70 factor (ECF subfamily)
MKQIDFRTDVLPLKNELYRMALRITLNPAEAEDVVQDTMVKVWNQRERWEQLESIEAFCLTVCRNLALDRAKRAENATQHLDDANDPPDSSYASNPEEQAVQKDRVKLVRQMIDQLPEKQKTCMQLRDFEGKSYKDIAKVMDISEQQVKINIFRARQTIRQLFIQTERYGLQVHRTTD